MPSVSSDKNKESNIFEIKLRESLQEANRQELKNERENNNKKLSRQVSMVRSRSTSELLGDEKGSPRITRHTSRTQLGEYFGSEDEINNDDLSGKLVLHIKTECKELIPRPRIRRSSSVTETHFATQVFSKGSTIRLEVHQTYTVWMIKVIIFDQFGGLDGFDPTSLCLYTLPDKIELKNDRTLESYSVSTGSTMLALPTVKKGQVESARRQPFALAKTKAYPPLCFAVGRGLSYAIVNFPSSFKIFVVSKLEKYLTSYDEKHYIVVEYVNGKKREIADIPLEISHVDKQGKVTVTYTPTKPGTYIISIQLKKQQICLSPFEVTAIEIDSNGAGLKEMAFSGWDIESASILANFSTNPAKHDIIFSIGMSVLLHLLGSPIEVIQKDMTKVLTNLLQYEENKIRLVLEGGIDLVKKVVKTSFWRSDISICRYLCRVIVWTLESNPNFGNSFLDTIGLDFCVTMTDSNDLETKRYSVKLINLLTNFQHIQDAMVEHSMMVELLLSLLSTDDYVIQVNSFHALTTIIKNYRFIQSLNDRKINIICGLIKSKERKIRLETLSILSEVEQQSLVNAYISGDIYLTIYNSFTFETSLLWWEIGIYTKANPQNYLSLLQQENSSDIPLTNQNLIALKFLNNILAQSSYDQVVGITEHLCDFANGEILSKVCRLAGVVDSEVQSEACRTLSFISTHETLRNKIITRGLEVWIVGSLRYVDPMTHQFVFSAVAKLSASFTSSTLVIDETQTIKTLLKLTISEDQFLRRQVAIILGHLLRNERYREGILANGKDILLNLMFEAASSGELTIHQTINYNDIVWENEIAVGAGQTKVFKGIINGKPCAIKSFDPVHDISFNPQEFQREVFIMSLFQHKRLSSCVCASTVRPNLFIASKLYTKGSLAEVLKNENDLGLPLIIIMLLDIAEGMSFLHSLNIIHRDIKPGNLLVNEDYRITITDFGTTRVAQKKMTATVGTPMYMAPDIINSEAYTTKIDVYSFGVLVWEILERKVPFPNLSPIETVAAVVNGERPPISPDNPLGDLITRCWAQNPSDRPTFPEIFDELTAIDEKFKSKFPSCSFKDKKKIRRVQSLFGDNCNIEPSLINSSVSIAKKPVIIRSRPDVNKDFNSSNNSNDDSNDTTINTENSNDNNSRNGSSISFSTQTKDPSKQHVEIEKIPLEKVTILDEKSHQPDSKDSLVGDDIMKSPNKTKHGSLGKNTAKKRSIIHGRNILKRPSDNDSGDPITSPPRGSIIHSSPKKVNIRKIESPQESNVPVEDHPNECISPTRKRESELMRATSIMKLPFQLMKNLNKNSSSSASSTNLTRDLNLTRNSSPNLDTPKKKEAKKKHSAEKIDSPKSKLLIVSKDLKDIKELKDDKKKKKEKDDDKKERKLKKKESKFESKKKRSLDGTSIKRIKSEKKKDSSDGTSPRYLIQVQEDETVDSELMNIPSDDDFEGMNSKQAKGRVRSKTAELRDLLAPIEEADIIVM